MPTRVTAYATVVSRTAVAAVILLYLIFSPS